MNKLRAKLVEQGMRVEDLCERAGISRNAYYNRIRTGPGSFRIHEVRAIAEVLALTPEEIREIFFS